MKLHLRRIISGKGSADHQFVGALRGLAVDSTGNLLAVGDRQAKRFGPDGSLQRRWPTARFGYCIAADPQGGVWVGEEGQVEQFDGEGRLLRTFRDSGRLGKVTAIAHWDGQWLLADAANRCIRRYDSQGAWLNDIGADNNTRGFLIPNGRLEFAVDDEGAIYAINSAKHRVERYARSGELLDRFGRFGMQDPQDFSGCCNPTNLALAPSGNLVVTEKAPPKLKVYTPQGVLLGWVGPAAFDANCLNMDVATDGGGRVYVADTARLQVCVFEADQPEALTGRWRHPDGRLAAQGAEPR